ncbi:LysR family transcriptional regulator [Halomonas sp. V046]|uniref:LysR family transcriptional regulator n=1 Tax=Halomonas sp. V046 TaxID=3459611 RepID=UPI00404505F2
MTYRFHAERLISFLAVAHTGSFRQAAAKLHLSQPPLTRRIQALEADLGVKLFERTTRRVALTPAGECLAARLRPCFAEIEAACDAVRQSGTPPSALAVGMTPAVDRSALPGADWLEATLEAPVHLVREPSRELLARLTSWEQGRRLQLAFIGLPCEVPGGLATAVIGHDPVWVALAEAHPLAAQSVIDLKRLNDTPLLWFARRDNPAYFDHCERHFRRGGYQPARREEPQDHHQLLASVAAAEGAALIPASFLATRRSGVVTRPLTSAWQGLAIAIAVAWRSDDDTLAASVLAALNQGHDQA